MKRWTLLAMWGVLGAASVPAWSAQAAASSGAPSPAQLQPYDILVHLERLPHAYSCDQLWSKFRAVLLALGAARVDEVLPSDCEALSPQVHLQFALPRLVPDGGTGGADLEAQRRIVTLRPGDPQYLENGDCRLVQEIGDSLLTDLPVRVLDSHFDCKSTQAGSAMAGSAMRNRAAAGAESQRFALSVQTLMPLWPQQNSAAAASGQG